MQLVTRQDVVRFDRTEPSLWLGQVRKGVWVKAPQDKSLVAGTFEVKISGRISMSSETSEQSTRSR